jgi:hypothetical protein
MGIAKVVYERTAIGAEQSLSAKTEGIGVGKNLSRQESLEQFQAVIQELERMEAGGKIKIVARHPESQPGNRYVDLVRFKRIR